MDTLTLIINILGGIVGLVIGIIFILFPFAVYRMYLEATGQIKPKKEEEKEDHLRIEITFPSELLSKESKESKDNSEKNELSS